MTNHTTTTKFIRSGTAEEVETDTDTYLATVDDGKTIHAISFFKEGGEYMSIIVHVT